MDIKNKIIHLFQEQLTIYVVEGFSWKLPSHIHNSGLASCGKNKHPVDIKLSLNLSVHVSVLKMCQKFQDIWLKNFDDMEKMFSKTIAYVTGFAMCAILKPKLHQILSFIWISECLSTSQKDPK